MDLMSYASFVIIWHFMSYDAYDIEIWHQSLTSMIFKGDKLLLLYLEFQFEASLGWAVLRSGKAVNSSSYLLSPKNHRKIPRTSWKERRKNRDFFCQLPLLQTLNPTLINVTNNNKPLHKIHCTTLTVPWQTEAGLRLATADRWWCNSTNCYSNSKKYKKSEAKNCLSQYFPVVLYFWNIPL